MSIIECECQLEDNVPVDSLGDFVCPKLSVRDMIKLYEEGKKSPSLSIDKSLTPSMEEMHVDYCKSEPLFRSVLQNEHETVVKELEDGPKRINSVKKVKDSKKYRSRTRILPTRHGIRIITDVFVKPR